ncbi:MAG TPA: serine hydrolase domain-containing protein, partial [Acidimicrobiia bacterium]|nr:serine hydrolase domain-containing protein [Acidimicrobiia bacterium]
LAVLGDFSRISAVSDAGSVNLTVPDDVYRVDAETSVGRIEVNVSTAPEAARVIVARSDAGNVTIDHLPAAVGTAAPQEGLGAPVGGSPMIPLAELGPTDAAELEAFLDELLPRQMEENHIPGAAVAVVRDGQVLLAKGYGYADLENGIPVDPELTVFRIGSSGKMFTWTAVMQLVEQGKLDLGADINTYLNFRIPDTYPQPITLEHLLTHTAGFEESWYETFTLDADEVLPAGEWLAGHIPARVRPPGDSPAYSNYGAELAGYIVERASGQPYGQYLQEHILDPLGMAYSSATGGMPDNPRAQASVGYFYADGAFEPVPDQDDYFGQIAMVPAGGHASSVADMARFLIAHLQDGFYGDAASGVRILEESTARQMQTTLFAPDPRLQGTAYGLFDLSDNGQGALGHNGDTLGFRSLLLLIPDQNLGVFVVYNSETAAGLELQHLGFQRAFFDHYYPAPPVEPIQPPTDFGERASRFEGTYQLTRMSYTTLEKYMELSGGGQVEISSPGDGTLLWTTPWGVWKFVEVEPLYFRQVDRSFGIAFHEDGQGRITHLFSDMTPMYTFEKLAWYETAGFNMALLAASLLIFLSMIVAASIGAVRSRRHRGAPEARGARAATRILLGISALNVLFVLGTFIWGNPKPMFGVAPAFQVVLGLGVLSAALTAGALAGMALAWKDRYWGTVSRLYYSVVTVAALAFVWFLNQWNLLGWRV